MPITGLPKAYADFSKDSYVWLQFDKEIKNRDGSTTQPLFIHYGQFPHKRRSIQELDKVEAFYTFGRKDKREKDIFYKLDIETEGDKSFIKINSKRINWCMALVRGSKINNGLEYNYYAKTSFFLFGHSGDVEEATTAGIDELTEPLDIRIYKERIRIEELTYNRSRNFPIRVTVAFDKKPLSNMDIYIANDEGENQRLRTDRKGNLVYNPRSKADLYSGRKEFEHDLILTASRLGNTIYKASYTVMFKSLLPKKREFSIGLGMVIFISSAVITFIGVVTARRKFKL